MARCPNRPDFECPNGPTCLGQADSQACRFTFNLHQHRSLSAHDQAEASIAGNTPFTPARGEADGRTRLGFWCPCLGLGGAETWMATLADQLDPKKFWWRGTICTDPTRVFNPSMAARIGEIMPIGRGLAQARALAGACDLIISWTVEDFEAIVVGLPSRPRIIQAVHFPPEAGAWGPGIAEWFGGVDRFVAVSTAARQSVPDLYQDRTCVIGNAVDCRKLKITQPVLQTRRNWNVPDNATIIGYLGRLSPEKDPLAMLRLDQTLPPEYHIVVVGDGPLRGQLETQASSRMHVTGADEKTGDVLAAFDRLVSPSIYESFGFSIAEALCFGLPVISTHTGVIRDNPWMARLIGTRASGKHLANAVIQSFEDPMQTNRFVDEGIRYALEHFGTRRFRQDWENLINSVGPTLFQKRQLIAACPSLGGELPLSLQPDCGCSHRRLSECRSQKGSTPGRVTILDCLDCITKN